MNIENLSHEELINNPCYKFLYEDNKYLKQEVKNLQITINSYETKLSILQRQYDINSSINVEEIKKDIMKKINVNDFSEYIELKNLNENYNNKIIKLEEDIKNIQLVPNIEDNEIFKKIKKQNEELNIKFEKQELKYNSLYNDYINLQNEKVKNIISSSPKTFEMIDQNEDNKQSIIQLPDNLLEVVYYRHVKSDKFLPFYNKSEEGKIYIKCCGLEKEINNTNKTTCIKCFRTYYVSEKDKIICKILPEHNISEEKKIYNKIKCNNCDNISKKEIILCSKCKYVEGCRPIVTKLPDEKIGQKTVECFASELYTRILFYTNVYKTAKNEGINVYEMRPLVEYIKENNLLKEKQPNMIIKKILRCEYILNIYNNDKYKNIQHIIKRIYFNLNYVIRLDDYQFGFFKDMLIDILDKELEKENNENININKICNIEVEKNNNYFHIKDKYLGMDNIIFTNG